MAGRALARFPTWVFPVLIVVYGLAGWYLLSAVLHAEGPVILWLYWLRLVLGLLAYGLCAASAWLWLRRGTDKAYRQE
jgi:hypothetical protein